MMTRILSFLNLNLRNLNISKQSMPRLKVFDYNNDVLEFGFTRKGKNIKHGVEFRTIRNIFFFVLSRNREAKKVRSLIRTSMFSGLLSPTIPNKNMSGMDKA